MYFYLLMNKDFIIIIIIKHVRLAMDCLSPQSISGAMCGNLFIDFSMFTLGLRNLALAILQLFPKSIITGLFSDPSMTTLLLVVQETSFMDEH